MGATAMVDIEQAQQEFIEMLPEVQRIAGHVFADLDSESREEAVAETVAMCWQNHLHCVGHGKEIGAPPRAHYATLGMRIGRTLCGQSSTDVLSPRTQILGRAQIRSLDGLHETTTDGGETWGWWNCTEALIDKRVWDRPPERVRIKLDYRKFLSLPQVTVHEREAFSLLARGFSTGEIAERLEVSPPRVCQIKDAIGEELLGFFGQEIWAGYNPRRRHRCRTKNGRRRS